MNILRMEVITEQYQYPYKEQYEVTEKQLVTELDEDGKTIEVERDITVTKVREVMRTGTRQVGSSTIVTLNQEQQAAIVAGTAETKEELAARMIREVKARARRDQEAALLASVADEIRAIEDLVADPQKQISDLQTLEISQ